MRVLFPEPAAPTTAMKVSVGLHLRQLIYLLSIYADLQIVRVTLK